MSSEKRNISEDLRMIKRGFGIVKELSPGLMALSILNSLLSSIIPYISIYMSAVIDYSRMCCIDDQKCKN